MAEDSKRPHIRAQPEQTSAFKDVRGITVRPQLGRIVLTKSVFENAAKH